MRVTLYDYATAMGILPSQNPALANVSCGALSCDDRERIANDILWAEATLDAAIGERGGFTDFHQSVIRQDSDMFFLADGVLARKIEVFRVTAPVSVDGNTYSVTFNLTAQQFDTGCDHIVDVRVVASDCFDTKLGVSWCSIPDTMSGTPLAATVTCRASDLKIIDCDTGATSDPEEVVLDIYVMKPSLPRAIFIAHTCGSTSTATCAVCNTEIPVCGCLARTRSPKMFRAQFAEQDYFCKGDPVGYELDTLRIPMKKDARYVDAVISLANSRRGKTDTCDACGEVAQARVRRDLGIVTDDYILDPALTFNGFGILTPGALSAWKYVLSVTDGTSGSAWTF